MKSRTVSVKVRIDDFDHLAPERTTTTTFSITYDPTRPMGLEKRDAGLNTIRDQLRRLLEATE